MSFSTRQKVNLYYTIFLRKVTKDINSISLACDLLEKKKEFKMLMAIWLFYVYNFEKSILDVHIYDYA